MPILMILAAIGGAVVLIKASQTVSAPTAGSRAEMQANVLPSNFRAWIGTASPRQRDAVRLIVLYQARKLNPSMDASLATMPGGEWATFWTDDPATNEEAMLNYLEMDMLYRQHFNLQPGPAA